MTLFKGAGGDLIMNMGHVKRPVHDVCMLQADQDQGRCNSGDDTVIGQMMVQATPSLQRIARLLGSKPVIMDLTFQSRAIIEEILDTVNSGDLVVCMTEGVDGLAVTRMAVYAHILRD